MRNCNWFLFEKLVNWNDFNFVKYLLLMCNVMLLFIIKGVIFFDEVLSVVV